MRKQSPRAQIDAARSWEQKKKPALSWHGSLLLLRRAVGFSPEGGQPFVVVVVVVGEEEGATKRRRRRLRRRGSSKRRRRRRRLDHQQVRLFLDFFSFRFVRGDAARRRIGRRAEGGDEAVEGGEGRPRRRRRRAAAARRIFFCRRKRRLFVFFKGLFFVKRQTRRTDRGGAEGSFDDGSRGGVASLGDEPADGLVELRRGGDAGEEGGGGHEEAREAPRGKRRR